MEVTLGYEKVLNLHVEKERAAVKLSSHIGELLYDKGIELVLFRNHLTDITVSEILNLHEYAKNVVNKPITIENTAKLAEHLLKMDLAPAKIDIGKLSNEWLEEGKSFQSLADFIYL